MHHKKGLSRIYKITYTYAYCDLATTPVSNATGGSAIQEAGTPSRSVSSAALSGSGLSGNGEAETKDLLTDNLHWGSPLI